MNEKVVSIMRTDNYDKFKFLPENRELNKASLKRIGRSIDEHGFLLNPIKVNENFEIIDGQHRFVALKERGLPIVYYVDNGADAESCRILNSNQKNWTTSDFIRAFSEAGVASYKWVDTLQKKYPSIKFIGILSAFDMTGASSRSTSLIREGKFEMTEDDYNRVDKRLEFYMKVEEKIKDIGTFARLDYRVAAVSFCYELELVDNKQFLEKLEKHGRMISQCMTLEQCVEEFSKVYNYKNREKVLIEYEYKKWRMARNNGGKK